VVDASLRGEVIPERTLGQRQRDQQGSAWVRASETRGGASEERRGDDGPVMRHLPFESPWSEGRRRAVVRWEIGRGWKYCGGIRCRKGMRKVRTREPFRRQGVIRFERPEDSGPPGSALVASGARRSICPQAPPRHGARLGARHGQGDLRGAARFPVRESLGPRCGLARVEQAFERATTAPRFLRRCDRLY
jgi:hypothetical protein